MQAPVSGTQCCCIPEVIYLGSGLEEKALRRWIIIIFRNLGAQYTVWTFMLLWDIL